MRAPRFFNIALLAVLSGLLSPGAARAAAVLTLQGKLFSVMPEEYVLATPKNLYYLKKSALPAESRDKLEKANTREISVQVPIGAITATKPLPPKDAPPVVTRIDRLTRLRLSRK